MSLADFYGLQPTAIDETVGAGAEEEANQKRNSKTALESEEFDQQAYLANLLREKSMRDLIAHDNSMIASKRALDSDMQTLVYDNYNRFISATDMIRKMKSNVESMESQMLSLRQNMDAISASCHGIESSLTPNRTQVENLLGVSRLLKRLEFLFELPGKLKRSIELGAYEQAVRYFRISSAILEQYKHHKSFEHIQRESEVIINELKVKLRQLIKQPNLTQDQQMSYTAMLVCDLCEPDSKELMAELIEMQKKKFQGLIQKAVDAANKPLMTGIQASRKGSSAITIVTEIDPASALSPSPDADLLLLLQQHFLNPYLLFTDTYLSTLIRPYETKQKQMEQSIREMKEQMEEQVQEEKMMKAGKGKQQQSNGAEQAKLSSASIDSAVSSLQHLTQSLTLSRDSLLALSLDLFVSYLTLSRRELIKRATITPQSDAAQVVMTFTSTLKSFYDALATPMNLLPKLKLGDRALELIHHALTHCVEAVCEHALRTCVDKMADSHQTLLAWQPGQSLADTPQKVSKEIRKIVEEALGLLVVALSTRDYLPEAVASGLSFTELARAHVVLLMNQLGKEMMYRTLRRSEGPVYDGQAPNSSQLTRAIEERIATQALPPDALSPSASSASSSSSLTRASRLPLFYLFLCQLASHQSETDIPSVVKTLNKFFPHAVPLRGAPPMRAPKSDSMLTDLTSKAKDSAQMLMLRYCETHGFRVNHIVRHSMLTSRTVDSPPRHPSSFVDLLQRHLHLICAELTLLLPADATSGNIRERNHDSSGRDLLGGGRSAAGGPKDKSGASTSTSAPGGGRAHTINRDIQRLFTQKISTFSGFVEGVDGERNDVVMELSVTVFTICKIAFKAMSESARMERLSPSQLHQLQLDLFTLRHELSSFLPSISSNSNSDHSKILNQLLDEAATSAQDRVVLGAASSSSSVSAQVMEDSALARIYETSRAARPQAALSPIAQDDSKVDEAKEKDSSSTATDSSPSAASVSAPTGALARLVLSPATRG